MVKAGITLTAEYKSEIMNRILNFLQKAALAFEWLI